MATSLKVSDLTAVTALAAGDLLNVVDVSDVTYSATGTNKKITMTNFFSGVPVPASFNDTLTLSKGSQNYLFTDRLTNIAIQGQTSGSPSVVELYSADGDGTDEVGFQVWGKGTPSAITNRERLINKFNESLQTYEIYTEANGTGTLRPLVIYTEGNANQLYLATGGQNIMGHNASIYDSKLEVVGSDFSTGSIAVGAQSADAIPPGFRLRKSRNATPGSYTILQDNDVLGQFVWYGDDGSNYNTQGAKINATVNGTPAGNRMPTDLEFYTAAGASNDDIALAMTLGKDAQLDLYGGTISILAGADNAAKTRTDGVTKRMRFGMPHGDNDASPAIAAIIYGASTTTANQINIGGNSTLMNAATEVLIFAADDATTLEGTEVARFEGGATKATMMGIGNSSLEDWANYLTAIQIGGNNFIEGRTATGVGSYFQMGNNAYFDGAWKYLDSDEASMYTMENGTHYWQVASSGTADAAISWTTALTIDNSANLTMANGAYLSVDQIRALDSTTGVLIRDSSGNDKITAAHNTDGQVTLNGGTGGVRCNNAFGLAVTPQAQQAHIVDADGTLADITTKFNTLLADLEGFGFLATS